MKNWELTRSQILAAPVPQNTKTYTAIPHRVFLEEVQEKLDKKNIIIKSESYLGTKGYDIMSGKMLLTKRGETHTELAPSIYFTNSYNKTKRASIYAGAMVLVCKNGMIGTIEKSRYRRVHRGTALTDFQAQINLIIDNLDEEFNRLTINMNEMKAIELDKATRAALVGDMIINERLITATQIGILRKEIDFSQNFKGTSAWDFYNHCTEAFKDTHPVMHDNQHIKFHTYMSDKLKLTGYRGLYGEGLDKAIILDEPEMALAD